MLLRITDYCTMGCNHCMINANVDGYHMGIDTYRNSLKFIRRYEPSILISGGEPTEHPRFIEYVILALEMNFPKDGIIILSNGMFLNDDNYTRKILDMGIKIQITNDPRYYPKRVEKINHPLITYEDKLRQISPFGRALENNIPITQQYPGCFNLRSVAGSSSTFEETIRTLRLVANRFCTPSINIDGFISAGETPFCRHIGTIYSSGHDLMINLKRLLCDQCGLDQNLTGEFKTKWDTLNSGFNLVTINNGDSHVPI